MDIVITGTSFTGATAVSFGSDITVSTFTVDSDTQITASITIAGNAALGSHDVSVTTPYGTGTLTDGFTVLPGGGNFHPTIAGHPDFRLFDGMAPSTCMEEVLGPPALWRGGQFKQPVSSLAPRMADLRIRTVVREE